MRCFRVPAHDPSGSQCLFRCAADQFFMGTSFWLHSFINLQIRVCLLHVSAWNKVLRLQNYGSCMVSVSAAQSVGSHLLTSCKRSFPPSVYSKQQEDRYSGFSDSSFMFSIFFYFLWRRHVGKVPNVRLMAQINQTEALKCVNIFSWWQLQVRWAQTVLVSGLSSEQAA